MAQQNEYLIPIGTDLGPLIQSLRQSRSEIKQLNDEAVKGSTVFANSIKATTDAQKAFVRETINANNAAKQQNAEAVKLAGVFDRLASSARDSGDSSFLKQYADDFKKIAEESKKISGIKIDVQDEELLALDAVLGSVTDEFKQLGVVVEFMKTKLAQLDPNSEEFQVLSSQIQTAENVLKDFGEGEESVVTKSKSLKGQLRALKEELAILEDQGKENTREFEEKAIAAGQLEDQIGDTAARIRVLASDTKYLDAGIQAIQGLAGAFAVAQGAQALFGSESKELQETLTKVTAVMNILQGLQTLQNILQKQSAVNVLLNRGAHAANTAAMGAETAAIVTLNTATKSFFATLLANPFGVLLGLVTALVAALSSMKSKAEEAAEAQAALNKELDVDADKAQKIADDLKRRQEQSLATLKVQSFTSKQIRDQEAADFEEFVKLRESQNKRVVEEAEKARKQLDIISKTGGKVTTGKVDAGGFAELRKASEEEITALQETLKKGEAAEKENADNLAKLDIKKKENAAKTNEELEDQRKKDLENRKKNGEKALEIEKQFQALLAELQKKYREANIQLIKDEQEKRIALEDERFNNEIAAIQKQLSEFKGSALQKSLLEKEANRAIEKLRLVHNKNLSDIDADYIKQRTELFLEGSQAIREVFSSAQDLEVDQITQKYQALIDKLAAIKPKSALEGAGIAQLIEDLTNARDSEITKSRNKFKIDSIEAEKDLALATIDVLRIKGIDEVRLTEIKEDAKLKVIKEKSQLQLNVILESLAAQNKLTREQIASLTDANNLQAAATKGLSIFDFLGIKIDDEETKKKITELLANINQVKEASKEDTGLITIFDQIEKSLDKLLSKSGLTKPEIQQVKDSFKALFSDIVSLYASSIDLQIQEKQRQVDALTKQIDSVEKELDRELELQKAGYANNVGAKKQEVEELKKQREKELEDEKKLAKEKALISSTQIAIDTVQQTSSLATAAAKIFEAHAGIPFVGVVLALAAVATMVTGFLAIKNQIKAATANVPKFRRGGEFDILDGRASHENKGVSLVEESTGRKLAEFEGDEKLFITSKGSSKKHLDLLRAINEDDFSGIHPGNASYRQLMEEMRNSSIMTDAPRSFDEEGKRTVVFHQVSHVRASADTEILEDINQSIQEFKEQERQRPIVIDYGDYVEVKTPGHTRKYKKSE